MDDDVAVQTTIRLILERAGHSVVVASDGRKGLAIFETGEFDLLFLEFSCREWTGSKPCGWFTSSNR